MELIELKTKIIEAFSGTESERTEIMNLISQDASIFPFNEYEHLICTLLDRNGITFDQYIEIRTDYINQNPNLWIFEISAPRGFGEKFAQTYVQGMSKNLKKPDKRLDPNYSGEYDLWYDGITIEVKASRAVDSDSDEPLYMRALSRNTQKRFLMNFQQLKPQCCDIFIWAAVFRDEIVLWIMKSNEVLTHLPYSKGQHRGNIGNEGQVHINNDNIHLLKQFELLDNDIEKAIKDANFRSG